MEPINAIYEHGVFKPLKPVSLPEGTKVRVEPEFLGSDELAERTYQQLLAKGASPERAKKIVDNFRLMWDAYASLTDEQKKGIEEARFDQANFFNRQLP